VLESTGALLENEEPFHNVIVGAAFDNFTALLGIETMLLPLVVALPTLNELSGIVMNSVPFA
jgi:hypothetical protein